MSSSPKLNPLTSLHSRIEAELSNQSELRTIDAVHTHKDEKLLNEIGYKQELKRTFKTYQIFGIAYSVMMVISGVASMTSIGLLSGPSGFVWSWFIAMHLIFCIALGMAELASAIPTSGGLYFWTYYYAPPNYRVLISFVIGLSNSMALCSTVVSATYTVSNQIQAAVFIHKDGDFNITPGSTYGIFALCLITEALTTSWSSTTVGLIQNISACVNTFMIVLFLIALPVGNAVNHVPFNGGKFIFGTLQNWTDWSNGWEFMLSMMACVWSIGAFDSCVHMSEEAKNASHGVPIGIITSTTFVGYICWICVIVEIACMSSNVESVLDADSGFPFAQIVYDSMGKSWSVAFMALIAAAQWIGCTSILAALSRQVWAFARDDGLPFAKYFKVVDKKLHVPIRALGFATIVGLLLGCLCLAGTAASTALFSLSVSGNYVSWCTPIFLRLTSGRKRFHPGPFYLGKILSPIVGWIAVLWGFFVLLLCMFPTYKSVDKTTMNYTCVITGGMWILSVIYFFVWKYKFFHGPKSNLSQAEQALLEAEIPEDVVLEVSKDEKE